MRPKCNSADQAGRQIKRLHPALRQHGGQFRAPLGNGQTEAFQAGFLRCPSLRKSICPPTFWLTADFGTNLHSQVKLCHRFPIQPIIYPHPIHAHGSAIADRRQRQTRLMAERQAQLMSRNIYPYRLAGRRRQAQLLLGIVVCKGQGFGQSPSYLLPGRLPVHSVHAGNRNFNGNKRQAMLVQRGDRRRPRCRPGEDGNGLHAGYGQASASPPQGSRTSLSLPEYIPPSSPASGALIAPCRRQQRYTARSCAAPYTPARLC